MLLILAWGIWLLASPESAWRYRKKCGDIRGIVMVESPSSETLRYIRLEGVVKIVIAVAGTLAWAVVH